jgi:DNA repair protein RecO (recombination protein O)
MRVSDRAIVLQAIRHGDRKYIVKLFTEKNGLVTALANAGKSPGAKVRTATLLPLTLLNCELVIKQNKELHQLNETSCYFISSAFGDAIAKLSIAQFLNELLIKTIREQSPNEALFNLTETCIRFLHDAEANFINLHLYFMLELCRHLGFEPQNNFSSARPYFDCREGIFTDYPLSFPLGLNKEESELFSHCLSNSLLQIKLSNAQRRQLLDILLAYFKLHVSGFQELKSLEVLQLVMH